MIIAAVEGYPDAEAVGRVLAYLGLADVKILSKRGKSQLDAALPELNRSARSIRCLIVRDLDNDATCPAELRDKLLPKPATNMLFRIAVKEIESWLIADHERFASFMGVPINRIPRNADELADPKAIVTGLAVRSRISRIRDGVPPRPGSGVSVGPGYAGIIGEYASSIWRPEVAANSSSSLQRCINRLRVWC
jgi:hypothetical protein